MDNYIDDELIHSLMNQYKVNKETATELAKQGMLAVYNTLQKASTFVTPYSNILQTEEISPMISVRHLQSSFGKVAELFQVKNRLPCILRAAGDGNCAMTTLALSIELETANRIALECLQENKDPPKEVPQLSGEAYSCAWNDGIEIRSYILRFYSPDRLHRELPLSFGDVTYEETTENGEKVFKTRRMTRCDILCTETQFSTAREIDMSLSDTAIQQRMNIASDYLKTISKSGQWCSTPSLVAFSFLRNPPKPIRVYQIDYQKRSIQKYIDIVPKECLPCCPTTEDEFLLDLQYGRQDTVGEIEKDLDDDEEWSEDEESSEEETTESSTMLESSNTRTTESSNTQTIESSTMQQTTLYTYNFTRILFTSNHYDLLATASERQRILHFWPEVESSFQTFDAEPIFKD